MSIKNYLKEIQTLYSPASNEHTYRTPLENLWNSYYQSDFPITQESSTTQGIPDFTIKNAQGQTIGFIECKDIDSDLIGAINNKKHAKNEYHQLSKYLTIAPILIYTNHTSFYLLTKREDKIEILDHTILLNNIDDKICLTQEQEAEFTSLLYRFTQSTPQPIKNQNTFISLLAKQSRILNELIFLECQDDASYFKSDIQLLFNRTIFKDLDNKDFAGSFAQIITFSLLFYRLTNRNNVSLNTFKEMPEYIPIFQELLRIFDPSRCNSVMLYTIESIINTINAYDEKMFHKDLSYKESHDREDPFIYLYENFLKEFDPNVRNARGVFYTPLEIVRYMIRSLDEILKDRLQLNNGLRHKDVHILDFAAGTGTFLLGAVEYIYKELEQSNNQGMWKSQVSDFILKQLYGFEFLVVPYILAHFRIHEYLNACGYEYKKEERLQLYLTNTLDNKETSHVPMFPKMNKEADMAYQIKNETPILVIMGNPPYNSKSAPMNSKKWISELITAYQTGLSSTEKGKLTYDEIKFIRFAQWKIDQVDKGIITLIVNNAFINGISHKVMREELMKSFDEIYIYDLHGNINKGEKNPVDGSMDFNVFNIKDVGVCIVTFVKTGIKDNPNKGVYFQEIFGTQQGKRSYINDLSWDQDRKDKKWLKLEDDPKWHWFIPRSANTEYWNDFIGLPEIFENITSGIKSAKDTLIIHKSNEKLELALKDIELLSSHEVCKKYLLKPTSQKIEEIKKAYIEVKNKLGIQTKIYYRPFDWQDIYYSTQSNGCIERPRYNMMKHFINKDNIGLAFSRQTFADVTFEHSLVVNNIIDLNIMGANPRIAPLYIYQESGSEGLNFDETKTPNFTKSFHTFKNKHLILKQKSPEEILAYIYAVLYSPAYRTAYAQDLSYDYPRIPFTDDPNLFNQRITIGQELIDLHLMKKIPPSISSFPVTGDNIITKPLYTDNKIYINSTQYFSNIHQEVWDYTIGGYQVLHKWLSSRKELTLNNEDITHLQNIITILDQTTKIVRRQHP